jgi:hypothetical protein
MSTCAPSCGFFSERFHLLGNLLAHLSWPAVAVLALLLLALPSDCAAQASFVPRAKIEVLSLQPARVRIEGGGARFDDNWQFAESYAGVGGLSQRIENLRVYDEKHASVPIHPVAPGQYRSDRAAIDFSYEVRLDAPLNPGDAAHVSWLTKDGGLFALDDLLPAGLELGHEGIFPVRASFSLPAGWSVAANQTRNADGQFLLTNMGHAVFFAGPGLRERRERAGSMELSFVTTGDWAFTDEEAAGMAASVLKDYAERLGGTPGAHVMLMLAPFPVQAGADRWSAETRGATVTLLSGKQPSKTAALVQLSTPLMHELFHLWIPNGLALDGNYDWFYEGFTNYQALSAGLRLGFLSFQDYLNALGRAFDAYLSEADRDKYSLPDASQHRWTSNSALVYHKGMLVAFLYDLELRSQTGGKRSLDDVYQDLFRRYHAEEKRTNGNTAVINALGAQERMRDFVLRYVESPSAIDLVQMAAPFGLRVERAQGFRTHVFVADSLSRSQRDLLRKFGYNNQPPRAGHK